MKADGVPRWMHRRRRSQAMTAATLVALFAGAACGSSTGAPKAETTTSSTTPYCDTHPNGGGTCVIEGRPLRGRRRRRLLLPLPDGHDGDHDARTEYASVAAFGELALRLIAVGAPVRLVEACHRAALEEIGHARAADELAGRERSGYGAIPALLGRRIGGRARSRRAELRRIAVESYVDGWLNEGAAAARLRDRAAVAATTSERSTLLTMADDEQGHANLARDIVLWCFDEEPDAVGRALAAVTSP